MAGQRCLDRQLGGFAVADFADEDDVGVLAEEGAEAGGEGDAALGVDLHLGDAVEVVLDGVFDGHDVAAGAVDA